MFERQPFDARAYEERIKNGPCFICEMVAEKRADDHIVYQTDNAIVFLNKYPTLYGYTLVAPRAHYEQVTGDFNFYEYLELQKLIYRVAEAVRAEIKPERVYILSLGSQQGNRHAHWHIAPLPAGVPFEQQQLEALRLRDGILKIPDEAMAALAARLRARIEKFDQAFIRPLAIGVFRRGDQILVFEGYDPKKKEIFYRPLGGGIEPGEYARDALARELREEIGAEIANVRYLGALENIFVYDGRKGHEIVLVFDATLADQSFYARDQIEVTDDGHLPITAMWKALQFFRDGNAPLYPDGLLDFLTAN